MEVSLKEQQDASRTTFSILFMIHVTQTATTRSVTAAMAS